MARVIGNSVAMNEEETKNLTLLGSILFSVDGAPGCPGERDRAGAEHVAAQGHLHEAAATYQGLPPCPQPEGTVSSFVLPPFFPRLCG